MCQMCQNNNLKFEATNVSFAAVISKCREMYRNKLKDYGASWRIMRPTSLTDQLYIKAKRIRNLEMGNIPMVDDDISSEFVGLVNYSIMALIQYEKGFSDVVDIDSDQALSLYNKFASETLELLKRKNHDYNEAWKEMRITSYTDLILTKLNRIKEIEDNDGATIASEGAPSNYMDIINYSVFALIKLQQKNEQQA